MIVNKEFQLNTIYLPISRWRYLLIAGFIVCCFWWMTPTWNQYVPSSAFGHSVSTVKNNTYVENGIPLSTFSTFECDLATLPDRVRMMRPRGKDYWLLGHGFHDYVTDGNWADGWEADFANKLELYLRVVKELEPSRGIFIDLGANIGTHSLHMAASGYETHAFEPTHANYVLTHCSFALSKFDTPVRFNHFGLGAEAQSACVTSPSDNLGNSVMHINYDSCAAEKRADIGTLNQYYRLFLRGRKVAVMKIDIQGFEILALEQGKDLFDSEDAPEVVFFECEPQTLRAQGSTPTDLLKYFDERDYLMITVSDGETVRPNLSDQELKVTSNQYMDIIAIKMSWIKKAENGGYKLVGATLRKLQNK